MILRQFCNPAGRLFIASVHAENVLEQLPNKAFVERDLYTVTNIHTVADYSLEEQFAQEESRAASILASIVEGLRLGILPMLGEGERLVLNSFIYNQIRRVPEFMNIYFEGENLQETKRVVIAAVHDKLVKSEKWYDETVLDPNFQQVVKVSILKSSGVEVMNTMRKFGFGYARPKGSSISFVIGSQPIALVDNHPLKGQRSFVFPISHDFLLYIARVPKGSDTLFPSLNSSQVLQINRATARQSGVVAGKDKSEIEKLKIFLRTRKNASSFL